MIILKTAVAKITIVLFVLLISFMFSQEADKFFVKENLKFKIMNIDSYIRMKYIKGEKIYVYVSSLNNENTVNFSISKIIQNNPILDVRYYKSDYATYIFSKKDRVFLKEYFNFESISNNKIPYGLPVESGRITQEEIERDSELGEILYRKCDNEFSISYIFLPFPEVFLMIEYNLQENAPALKGSVH